MGHSVPDTRRLIRLPSSNDRVWLQWAYLRSESSLVILGRAPFIRSRPFST